MIKSEIFSAIRKELEYENNFEKKAVFSSFSDGVLTYQIKEEDIINEFRILADDNFLKEETPKELLIKKRIEYFEHTIYIKEGKDFVSMDSLCYNPKAQLSEN